jgi:ribosomal protein S11
MQQAASTHGAALGRISFKGTLDTVRHFAAAIHAARATPRKQDALIEEMLAMIAGDCVPERPGRSEPRAKNYHLLTKPRSEMTVPPHRNRPRPPIQKTS